MADTTALKNRIRAAIKANDNQEITGSVLQQALLDMVDELNGATETEASQRQSADSTLSGMINSEAQQRQSADSTLHLEIGSEAQRAQGAEQTLQTAIRNLRNAGYAFGGIAVTATNPGVPSGNCFYIVRGTGTYTYFKNADNESIVLENDGIYVLTYESVENNYWEWNLIVGIDDEPIPNSLNLPNSGGVVTDLGIATRGIKVERNKVFSGSGDFSNYNYNNNPTYDTLHIVVDAKQEKSISIEGVVSSQYYFFFNSYTISGATCLGANTTGVIPSGSVVCVKNCKKSDNPNGYDNVKVIKHLVLEDVEQSLDGLSLSDIVNQKARSGITNKPYIDKNHSINISTNPNQISYIDNNNCDSLWYSIPAIAKKITVSGAEVSLFAFYDSISPTDYNDTLAVNYNGDIPEGAKLAIINAQHEDNTEGLDNCIIKTDEESYLTKRLNLSAKGCDIIRGYYYDSSSYDFVQDNRFDCLIINCKPYLDTISVSGVTIAYNRVFYFNDYNLSADSYLGFRQDGSVPDGALVAFVNINKNNNAIDYYKNLDIKYTFDYTLKAELESVDAAIREKTEILIEPDTILDSKRVYNGAVGNSTYFDVWVFNNINPGLNYRFSGSMSSTLNLYFITYWDENDVFIGNDTYNNDSGTNIILENVRLNVPSNAKTIKMNVEKFRRNYYSLKHILMGDFINFETFSKKQGSLKVVVKEDGSFYIRHHIDDDNDGILVFDYYNAYNYVKNCISQKAYYIGSKNDADSLILSGSRVHNCRDCISPMFTQNFGPMFSNHGYCTPRVVVSNHGLTASDIGSEWIDQNDYHYTIGHIDGDTIYLLPVIYSTGVQGYEYRNWVYYSSPYPTQITRNVTGGETLQVASSSRYDYQVSEIKNLRININGCPVGMGTYYCENITMSYEQVGYNPININQWWPTIVYNGIMLYFERTFSIFGGNGSLSLAINTVVNNQYPYPVAHYIDTVPMFPFAMGDYHSYIYIPKMLKHDGDIDFRHEFVSNDGTHAQVSFSRNATDIENVDNMPERAYAYLKNNSNNILFGCAGGKSLVRGMSIPSIRNNYIRMNKQVGSWYPSAGNKFYSNIINPDGDDNILLDNILPSSFINEFEGYMCWYKPTDDIHTFYYKSKECFVVYIHTNKTFAKGIAVVPDFMNGMEIVSVVEKTDGINILTNTVINGKLYFTSDNNEIEYNYIVLTVR